MPKECKEGKESYEKQVEEKAAGWKAAVHPQAGCREE
jgi:hypothetical protein